MRRATILTPTASLQHAVEEDLRFIRGTRALARVFGDPSGIFARSEDEVRKDLHQLNQRMREERVALKH